MGTSFSVKLSKSHWLLAIGIVLLWFLATPEFQYANLGHEDVDFPGSPTLWTTEGEAANAVVGNDSVRVQPVEPGRTHLTRFYSVPADIEAPMFVRLTGTVVSTSVKSVSTKLDPPGPSTVSLLLVRFKNSADKWVGVWRLAELYSPDTMSLHSQIYALPAQATGFKVGLILRHSGHSHELSSLSIEYLGYSNLYIVSVLVTLAVGLALFAQHLFRYIAQDKLSGFVVLIAAAIVLAGVLMPSRIILSALNTVITILPSALGVDRMTSVGPLQDYGHTVGFAFLAFVVLCVVARSGLGLVSTLVTLLLFLVLTEVVQRHSANRSASFEDIGLDLIGLIIGGVVFVLFRWLSRQKMI